MDRLTSPLARLLLSAGCLVAGVILLISSWSNIRDETAVAIQLPDILSGGVGALMLTVAAAVLFRSASDGLVRDRLGAVESTNQDLRERVDYLTQLLEAALLPDQPLQHVRAEPVPAAEPSMADA
jgi:hypothetical protein